MLEKLLTVRKVVGSKQSLRVIRAEDAKEVYIASDAEDRITSPIRDLCRETGIPAFEAPSMAELGRAAGIESGAAVVTLLK